MRLRTLAPALLVAFAALFAGSAVGEDRPGATASQAGPRVFGAFEDVRTFMSSTGLDSPGAGQLALTLPAGSYVIQAKATLLDAQGAHCRLSTDSDFDETRLERATGSAPLALTVLHTSSTSFVAALRCVDTDRQGPLGRTEDKKIAAFQVGQLSNRRG